MAITDDIRIVIKVCQLYYEENLSQKEISAQLGISRPQISRLLATARSNNIVSININNPYAEETRLEKELVRKYKIKDALIVNTTSETESNKFEVFSAQAAKHLHAYIRDNDLIGVMSGKTISYLLNGVNNFERYGLDFIPLVGGIGAINPEWHANVIAQKFAEKLGGKSYMLNAPVVVQNEQACEIFMKEPEIASVIQLGKKCNVTIVGIGQVNLNSTNVRAGALTQDDIKSLVESEAVASVCTSYLNSKGEIIETSLSKRSIGQTLNDIKNSKTISCAIGDSKVAAIKAALLSGYIDVFMTDMNTAQQL
ncbi:MAG: transcriptional regulator [Lachnospiraceae bacterium]|nr:transcriptional regulator [Lachnospiraceae bacterium]